MRRFVLIRILIIAILAVSHVLNSSGQAPVEGVLFLGFGQERLDRPAQSESRIPGPRPPMYENFHHLNLGRNFASGEYVAIPDPGDNSQFDFSNGDSITLEAFVSPEKLGSGQHAYVIGKGRTDNPNTESDNQNFALRLTGAGSQARVSFLFRDARPVTDEVSADDRWHRWTSKSGFATRSGWHHVAITYTFGHPESIRGYVDGKNVTGQWDMGGPSSEPPVNDNDAIWVGSGNGDSPSNRFHGKLDSVAVHRVALSEDVLKSRFAWNQATVVHTPERLPADSVLMEVFEDIPVDRSWQFEPQNKPVEVHQLPFFALHDLPEKYGHEGIRVDRNGPVMVRLSARMHLQSGTHHWLMRSLNGARLFINGELVATNPFIFGNADGHGEVGTRPDPFPENLRFPQTDHKDNFVEFDVASDASPIIVTLEAIIGGTRLPMETGEISLTVIDNESGTHRLVSPDSESMPEHTDAGWGRAVSHLQDLFDESNRSKRLALAAELENAIEKRHRKIARTVRHVVSTDPPEVSGWAHVNTTIDRFIQSGLEADGLTPLPMVDDLAFLRRVSLDATGLPPSSQLIKEYFEWPEKSRRALAIEAVLNQPGWADNWVGYWQDVLAENPAILKPTLNNTGPFRYWIHESFADNKPFDQFIRELVMMEGSAFGGGPAGFAVATQNDVPMADKAQILTQAFMAGNLACARCHDAPFHDFRQEELFGMAAMLKREAIKLPESSSLPVGPGIRHSSLVDVTLKPGETVKPHWAFGTALQSDENSQVADILGDTREAVAVRLTEDNAFLISRVFVNRLWKNYLGLGLVEPVDDWEDADAIYPELLDWMAGYFIEHGFDVKEMARLIFSSQVYQREAVANSKTSDFHFEGVIRRRMTAEQLVDSLLAVTGRPMVTERLTLDNDARRMPNVFLNLGYPTRAWEFTGLSNDRDRPALSMPRTQEIVDFLKYFGWRETRQGPLTERDPSPNIMQPANVANSNFVNARAVTLTDNSQLTELALMDQPLVNLIDELYLRILTRLPSESQRALIESILAPDYDQRVISHKMPEPPTEFDPGSLLSWSNHLNAKATEIKLLIEERALNGDQPSERLLSTWREALEDVVWALVNSPEFLFIP